jgi:hypothetical protein
MEAELGLGRGMRGERPGRVLSPPIPARQRYSASASDPSPSPSTCPRPSRLCRRSSANGPQPAVLNGLPADVNVKDWTPESGTGRIAARLAENEP